MEFWGVEVKPGETVKCNPGEGKYLRLSQAALGEIKKDKGNENVPLFLKFNNQKHVIGTLFGEKCAQLPFDLVLEKAFELSHSSKNTSVHFCGYKTTMSDDHGPPHKLWDIHDIDSDEENLQPQAKENGKPEAKAEPAKPAARVTIMKADASTRKPKTGMEEPNKAEKQKVGADGSDSDEDEDEDEDDDLFEDDFDDDEDMVGSEDDSDNEDSEGSGDEDEDSEGSGDENDATPQKVESGKKRQNEAAAKTPAPEKKAKLVSPAGQKTGGDRMKGGHIATPHPAKQARKTPAANDGKSRQQTPKSSGSVTCTSCNKSFNSDNALQAHSKAKHGAN